MSDKVKKPFKDTGFGKFLNKVKDNAGIIIDVAAEVATGDITGAIEKVRGELSGKAENDLKAKELLLEFEKEQNRFVIEMATLDIQLEQEITKRWESDSNSGNKLVLMTRPLIVLYSVFFTAVVAVLDSIPNVQMEVSETWLDILNMLLITSIGGYFAARSMDKYTKTRGK